MCVKSHIQDMVFNVPPGDVRKQSVPGSELLARFGPATWSWRADVLLIMPQRQLPVLYEGWCISCNYAGN